MSLDQHDPHDCEVCDSTLPARTGRGRGRRYCSRACQQNAYRGRRTPPPDPRARLDDLRSSVAACWAALQQGDLAAVGDTADTAARAARALAHTARQSITTDPVTKPAEQQAAPVPPASPPRGGQPRLRPAETDAPPPPPRQPVPELGDGYELQPPADPGSTRWSLFHHGQRIGHVERTRTLTGRSTRWQAHSPTGRQITAATTTARDGAYRTKRDALVQVALDHQLINRRGQLPKRSHGR